MVKTEADKPGTMYWFIQLNQRISFPYTTGENTDKRTIDVTKYGTLV